MESNQKVRVLVVDDSAIYRKAVKDALAHIEEAEVVGTANNGKIALSAVERLKPDLVTLDVEMPEMNGLQALSNLKRNKETAEVGVVMLSSLTKEGSEITIKALEMGAFDFVAKPMSGTREENQEDIRRHLKPIVAAFVRQKYVRDVLRRKRPVVSPSELIKGGATSDTRGVVRRIEKVKRLKTGSKVIAIGISTGGPNALAKMMPLLKADINVPILIVQHMPPVFTKSLADSLNSKCAIEVKEATPGEEILPNVAYIAPGGKQMSVGSNAEGKKIITIIDAPPENSCKPSADYLFRSVASQYSGVETTGVIMTGMGSDGALGLEMMKNNDAVVIAQDELSCTVYGMPRSVVENGTADVVAPLEQIAKEIVATLKP